MFNTISTYLIIVYDIYHIYYKAHSEQSSKKIKQLRQGEALAPSHLSELNLEVRLYAVSWPTYITN